MIDTNIESLAIKAEIKQKLREKWGIVYQKMI